jgi:2-oxoglutarate ferredoxin oxidoreductase subunit alpha
MASRTSNSPSGDDQVVVNKLSWLIGGAQGSGINVSAEVFAKACARAGLFVFSNIEYHSNITGKHAYYRVRVNQKPIHSPIDGADLFLALDRESLFGDVDAPYPTHRGHIGQVTVGGGIIYDAELGVSDDEFGRDDIRLFPVPYGEVLKEGLSRGGVDYEPRRHDIMRNMVSVAASFALLGMKMDEIVLLLGERLGAHRKHLVDMNEWVLDATADYVNEHYGDDFPVHLQGIDSRANPMLIRGADASALGKLHAGCSFQSYYPIAPATEESEVLTSLQGEFPIIVLQGEDEIACINMAIGAAHAGARASTATSGPGFSLMAEGIGFASVTEAPGPVITIYQRGGPSTGLPTRQAQGDLRFAVHPGHSEFPHVVLAPGDVQEALSLTFKAFNYADQYQLPVIVLMDRFLANSFWTVDELNFEGLKVNRGELYEPNGSDPYKRHKVTDSGVSPRSVPGQPGGQFVTTSDEHNEYGKISEGIPNRHAQVEKRMRKLAQIERDAPVEDRWELHGTEDADVTVVAWGSTKGAILDAHHVVEREGITVNYLQIRMLRPFPADAVATILEKAKMPVLLEDNFEGQLGRLIAEETGIKIERMLLKYSGRPFSQNEVETGLLQAARGEPQRIVLSTENSGV